MEAGGDNQLLFAVATKSGTAALYRIDGYSGTGASGSRRRPGHATYVLRGTKEWSPYATNTKMNELHHIPCQTGSEQKGRRIPIRDGNGRRTA